MPSVSLPYEFPASLRTARLLLRPMADADLDDIHAYHSRPDVCRYLPFAARSRDEVAEKIAKHPTALVLNGDSDYWQLAIERDSDPGHVIGDVYFAIKDTATGTCEIGWILHPDHTGSGYMTEAAHAVLNLGFHEIGVHRAIANLDPRNHESAALCTRLGMRHEAHFVQDVWFRGEWADTAIYAILDREWASRRS
jgi:RimJ/RimL family protein N-acetyltransferase